VPENIQRCKHHSPGKKSKTKHKQAAKNKKMQQKTSSKTEATAPPNQPANRTPDNS
jgi:hypothetical protein